MIEIREATDDDIGGILDVISATYGDNYTCQEFYDQQYLKKLVFNDRTLVLVAVDADSGRVLGTGSVILEIGAYTDLVGEFGRLAVHPEVRGQGVGTRIMEERLARVRDRLHVGLIEGRVTHPFTLQISQAHGFAPVGFLPMAALFGDHRESFALLVQYFGNALELRRNHPRLIPEAYGLACVAMDNVGLEPDVIVDEESAAYPRGGDFEVQELTADGYSSLLRIERGRVRKREIFGPLRLHYGIFKLLAEKSNYLIARRDGVVVGAVGYTRHEYDQLIRVFELISLDERVVRFLLRELERTYTRVWETVTVHIDVRADAPRMQRTLLEFGFMPIAYVPALAFHRVERLDVVRMMRLLRPLDVGEIALIPPTEQVAKLVLRGFARHEVLPRIKEVVDRITLFDTLNDEQIQRVAGTCGHVLFKPGECIFEADDDCTEMFLLLEGEVAVEMPGASSPVGTVGRGECLGEVAFLTGGAHSATALATTPVEAGVMSRRELGNLVRQRPDIGVTLYRNLARGLGTKLKRADLAQLRAE